MVLKLDTCAMLNCCVSQAWNPSVCTLEASVGVGPNAACSRNRRAAAAEACAFATPTYTGKGWETAAPLLILILPAPETEANPVTVNTPPERLVPKAVPLSDAIDVAAKPLPVIVVVKMPSGNCPFAPTPVMTGVGGISVTVAVAFPFGPVAVTASVPVADMPAGAVYIPPEVTDP